MKRNLLILFISAIILPWMGWTSLAIVGGCGNAPQQTADSGGTGSGVSTTGDGTTGGTSGTGTSATTGGTGVDPCSCEGLSKDCGIIDDNGCGVPIDCGTCPSGEACGGGGTANVCGDLGTGALFDQFAFVSNRGAGGYWNLHLGNTAMFPPKPLTQFTYPPSGLSSTSPQTPSFSPGGTTLAYTLVVAESKFDLSRLNVPQALSTPPTTYSPWLDQGGNTILGVVATWNPKDGAAVFLSREEPNPPGGCGLLLKKISPSNQVTVELSNPDVPPNSGTEDWRYGKPSLSPVTDPASPFYQKIVFAVDIDPDQKTSTKNSDYDLYLKTYGDGDPAHIVNLTNTPGTRETDPSLSPDGSKVVFTIEASADRQVWIADLTAGPFGLTNKLQLTDTGPVNDPHHPWKNTRPCITKNGKVLFVSDRNGNKEIYSMNLDGSAETNLTNDPADDTDVACGPTVILYP